MEASSGVVRSGVLKRTENVLEIDSDELNIERTPLIENTGNVKDSIRALNKQFDSKGEKNQKPEKRSKSSDDDEFYIGFICLI